MCVCVRMCLHIFIFGFGNLVMPRSACKPLRPKKKSRPATVRKSSTNWRVLALLVFIGWKYAKDVQYTIYYNFVDVDVGKRHPVLQKVQWIGSKIHQRTHMKRNPNLIGANGHTTSASRATSPVSVAETQQPPNGGLWVVQSPVKHDQPAKVPKLQFCAAWQCQHSGHYFSEKRYRPITSKTATNQWKQGTAIGWELGSGHSWSSLVYQCVIWVSGLVFRILLNVHACVDDTCHAFRQKILATNRLLQETYFNFSYPDTFLGIPNEAPPITTQTRPKTWTK